MGADYVAHVMHKNKADKDLMRKWACMMGGARCGELA